MAVCFYKEFIFNIFVYRCAVKNDKMLLKKSVEIAIFYNILNSADIENYQNCY